MDQTEKRKYLIGYLLNERGEKAEIPPDERSQKRLLRSLFNIRMPKAVSEDFLKVQDEYLQEETASKGITDIADLKPLQEDIYLWQGDITTLKCDVIVNAANPKMLGCFIPCHGCIDNVIHTYAGIQLRNACYELMKEQGYEERTGQAKITPAYNLPCRYVIHTVGPIVGGRLTENDCELLKSCYLSCLNEAVKNNLKSIAFCCISTGEFHFPNDVAAQIAVKTVKEYQKEHDINVIFNVFKDHDHELYNNLLSDDRAGETFCKKTGVINNGKKQIGSVQRRRAGYHYNDYGVGTETTRRRQTRKFARARSGSAQLRAKLFVCSDLLGESP